MLSFSSTQDLRVQKGMNLNFDSYSGFVDDGGTKTAMEAALNILGITNLIVIGVATDYCVQATVLDALNLNKYRVYVVTNLCRGVDSASSFIAFKKMRDNDKGAQLIELKGNGITQDKLTSSLSKDKLLAGTWDLQKVAEGLRKLEVEERAFGI